MSGLPMLILKYFGRVLNIRKGPKLGTWYIPGIPFTWETEAREWQVQDQTRELRETTSQYEKYKELEI